MKHELRLYFAELSLRLTLFIAPVNSNLYRAILAYLINEIKNEKNEKPKTND